MTAKQLIATALGLFAAFTCLAGVSVSTGTLADQAGAGDTYEREITVRNSDDVAREVMLYQTDYLFDAEGRNHYNDPGSHPGSNADWISFNPRRLLVPPRGETKIAVRVQVPDDDRLVGTYWSMVMVEGISPDSALSAGNTRAKPRFGVFHKIRYSVQVITSIGDTGTRELQFRNLRLSGDSGKRLLQWDLHNSGQRWLRPDSWVEIFDSRGLPLGRFDGGGTRLFPTTSARMQADLSELPAGTYKATIIADGGGEDLFGTVYTLKVKSR